MTFEDNFNYHSKEYIFSNDDFLSNERKKIFNKIKLKDFDKKNNESIKNISFSDLSLFDYHYNFTDEIPKIVLVDKYIYKINIINGVCKNYEDDNIEIRNAKSISININKKIVFKLLYDKSRSLQKKIKIEQLRRETS